MVKFILINIFLFLTSVFFAQIPFDETIDTNGIKDIYLDQMDGIYLEYNDGHFVSYIDDNKYTYFNELGAIDKVDVKNPQKILLFYRDFQQIVILDNTLSQISAIDLEELTGRSIGLATLSKRNNIWVFDEINNSLLRMDNNGIILSESDPIYYYKSTFTPKAMYVINNMVLLLNSDSESLIFDNFGQFITTGKLGCKGEMSLSSRYVYCLENDILKISQFLDDKYIENVRSQVMENKRIEHFGTNRRKLIYLEKNRNRIMTEFIH